MSLNLSFPSVYLSVIIIQVLFQRVNDIILVIKYLNERNARPQGVRLLQLKATNKNIMKPSTSYYMPLKLNKASISCLVSGLDCYHLINLVTASMFYFGIEQQN